MPEAGAQALELTERLRKAFDESFGAPRPPAEQAGERLLSIHAGGEAFALPLLGRGTGRTSQVSGLEVDRMIVPLHSGVSEFLGLVAVSGALIPAFDLASLAGLPRGASRWLALLKLPASAAVAFESLDGLVELPTSDVRPVAASGSRASYSHLVDRLARRGERFLPVFDLDAIGEAIRDKIQRRAGSTPRL